MAKATTLAVNTRWAITGAAEGLEDHLDQVMAELVDLTESDHRLADPQVALDLAQMTMDIGLTGTGETWDDARLCALAAIRSAIHTAGGATPDWETAFGVHQIKADEELVTL